MDSVSTKNPPNTPYNKDVGFNQSETAEKRETVTASVQMDDALVSAMGASGTLSFLLSE